MKKTIAIFVMLAVLCSSFAFFMSAGEPITFEDILAYRPPSGTTGCTNSRLIYEGSGTIPLQQSERIGFTQMGAIVNTNPAVHEWGQIPIKQGCNYRIEACGTVVGEGHADVMLGLITYPEWYNKEKYVIELDVGEVRGNECATFYWNPDLLQNFAINGIPEGVEIDWIYDGDGYPALQYNFKIYEECTCSLPIVYPKVDIEQFSVAGGDTIIRDGKLLSNFEIAPGVQQTFIQVENRGFFTQKDARVKLLGLPQGVTVKISPETQKLKAHNIGTYSAEFTVDSNVPSGTYDVTMVAYSPTGTFDTIPFKFVVP